MAANWVEFCEEVYVDSEAEEENVTSCNHRGVNHNIYDNG
jgi:hypothetical protein